MNVSHTINRDILIEHVDDTTIIFFPESSTLFTLNRTSAYILSSIQQEMEEHTIITRYAKIFSVSIQVAKKDVKNTISKLKKFKIIL